MTGTQKSVRRDAEIPVRGPRGEEGKEGNEGKPREPQAQDPRLALADAINAQTERAEQARRTHPPARMGEGSAATLETTALRERFLAVLERYPAGTPERTRLAACRLATPVPEVLRRTCEDMGGLERVADVLAWAWAEHAQGRLGALGRADPAVALRDAFRGEGRYWPGIVDAYTRRPGEQRTIAWRPPDMGHVVPVTEDEMGPMPWETR